MGHYVRRDFPRPAAWLIGCFLPKAHTDALIGDLLEERALRSRLSAAPDDASWYKRQIARSLASLFWAAARRGQWVLTLGAAFAAHALVNFIEFGGGIVLSQLRERGRLEITLTSLAVSVAAMVLGGYLAARIRRGAAVALAALSAAGAIRMVAMTADAALIWYQLPFLILCPAAALAGRALSPKEA